MSIRQNYKTTEIGEIPEDWEVVRLEEIATQFISGGTPSTSNPEYWDGNIPWMKSAWIEGRFVDSGEKYITKKGLRNSAANIVPQDNLLVATRVCIGNVAINKIDIAISQDLTGVVIEKRKAFPEYVYWALRNLENKVRQLVQGSTIKGVLREDLRKIKIPHPSLPEQRKIASVLSTVEDAIQKTDEVISKAEILKRGLMQRLFTRGIGHTEFKQTELGEIPEMWKMVRLKELCHRITKGTTPTTYGFNYTESGINFIKVENIDDRGNFLISDFAHISQEANKLLSRSMLEREDILFSIAGALGRSAIVSDKILPANTNQALAIIRLKKEAANVKYMKFFLDSHHIQKHIKKIRVQSAQANLSLTQVGNFEIILPPKDEQGKITDLLSKSDKKITLEKRKKRKLEDLKKGLMQVLLTGKARVKVT